MLDVVLLFVKEREECRSFSRVANYRQCERELQCAGWETMRAGGMCEWMCNNVSDTVEDRSFFWKRVDVLFWRIVCCLLKKR